MGRDTGDTTASGSDCSKSTREFAHMRARRALICELPSKLARKVKCYSTALAPDHHTLGSNHLSMRHL